MSIKRIKHVCDDSCEYYKSRIFEIGNVYCTNVLEARRYCVNCIKTYNLGSTYKIDGMEITLTGCESQCNFCDGDLKLDRCFSTENAREYSVIYNKVRGLICSGCFYDNYIFKKSSYEHVENYKLTHDNISFFQKNYGRNIKENTYQFDCKDCGKTKLMTFEGNINCCDLQEENDISITINEYNNYDSDDDSDDDSDN